MRSAAELDANVQTPRPSSRGGWLSSAFNAGYRTFGDTRLASAGTLACAASRILLTGSGAGYEVAGFGAAAFSETGFDAIAVHAGDLTARSGRFRPGDLLLGIDTDSPSVARAMRRARRAGIHSIGVTTRDLTIIDPDVLLPVPIPSTVDPASGMSQIACCLALALVVARIEPGTALAGEIGSLEKSVRRTTHASQHIGPHLAEAASRASRIVVAGLGHSSWAATALVRDLTALRRLPAVAAHTNDIDEGLWSFALDDVLIEIDPVNQPADKRVRHVVEVERSRPPLSWSFRQGAGQSDHSIHLPAASSAIRSFIAFASLKLLFDDYLHACAGIEHVDV